MEKDRGENDTEQRPSSSPPSIKSTSAGERLLGGCRKLRRTQSGTTEVAGSGKVQKRVEME